MLNYHSCSFIAIAPAKDYITYQDFRQQFDQGIIHPVYLFQGQEWFLLEEALDHIRQTLIRPDTADFNYAKLSAKEVQIGEVLDFAQTIPFLSNWRLIVLTDIHELSAQDQKALIPYLADPNQSTCLVMTVEKLDGRTKFAQLLKKQAQIVQFWKLFDRDVPGWIRTRAQQYGYTIVPQAATYLMDLVGNNLRQLDNELKKIIAYVKTGEISLDIVQQVVGDIREHDIFELVDAVGAGNVIEALRILNQLLIEGEPPLKILMMVVRQFRLLWKVKATLVEKKSMPPRQLAGQIGVPARTAEQLSQQVRRFSQVQLKQGLKRLAEVDRALKSSTNAPKILLEDVAIDLCLPS